MDNPPDWQIIRLRGKTGTKNARDHARCHRLPDSGGPAGRGQNQQSRPGGTHFAFAIRLSAPHAPARGAGRDRALSRVPEPREARLRARGVRAGVDAQRRKSMARALRGSAARMAGGGRRVRRDGRKPLSAARARAQPQALFGFRAEPALQGAGRDGHPFEHRAADAEG